MVNIKHILTNEILNLRDSRTIACGILYNFKSRIVGEDCRQF